MFHRAGGKLFFYVLTLMFFLVSIQNTWDFLNTALPDATPFFLACMMAVFEGGFFMWLALLMHGAENVWRVGLSAIMLLVTGVGVGTGAYYELSGMMHKGIGAHIDPGIMQWIPTSVLIAYLATFAAIMLYILADPRFFFRMQHMNATGQAPEHMQIFPAGNFNPFAQVSQALPGPTTEPLALPAPRAAQNAPAVSARPNLFQRAAAGIGGLVNGSKKDANNGATVNAQQPVQVTEEPDGGTQASTQDDTQPVTQPAAPARLGLIESKMLEAFQSATPEVQTQLEEYAATHTLAELVAFLQQAYPNYSGVFNEERVQRVMDAFRASRPAPEPQPVMQNSAPPRSQSARRKPAATGPRTSRSTSSGKRGGNWQVILPALDKEHPGLNDGELARVAGCSQSTVSRWRASLAQAQSNA